MILKTDNKDFPIQHSVNGILMEEQCIYSGGAKWNYKYKYSRVSFWDVPFYDDSLFDRCRVGLSTPDLCITVPTQASFLYLVHF